MNISQLNFSNDLRGALGVYRVWCEYKLNENDYLMIIFHKSSPSLTVAGTLRVCDIKEYFLVWQFNIWCSLTNVITSVTHILSTCKMDGYHLISE